MKLYTAVLLHGEGGVALYTTEAGARKARLEGDGAEPIPNHYPASLEVRGLSSAEVWLTVAGDCGCITNILGGYATEAEAEAASSPTNRAVAALEEMGLSVGPMRAEVADWKGAGAGAGSAAAGGGGGGGAEGSAAAAAATTKAKGKGKGKGKGK
jgi:hypothetical protein